MPRVADLMPSVTDMPPFLYGRVLQAGLGIGVLARRILECSAVTELVTIEIHPDVVASFVNQDPRHTIQTRDWQTLTDQEKDAFDFVVVDLGQAGDGWQKAGHWTMHYGGTR